MLPILLFKKSALTSLFLLLLHHNIGLFKNSRLKLSTIFLLVLGLNGLHAQEVLSASGGELSGSGGTVIYSVGQIVYTTNTGTNGSVAQGVHQPFEISITLGVEIKNISLDLSVYPNPTTSYLNLKVKNNEFSFLAYQLFDMQGKLLEKSKLTNNSTTINMERLPSSTYFLNVTNKQNTVKTFKIIKN
ncbi:MAG: T9SS type A sorting domain-containing protein [Flavobacteriaceae bacterium]|nr:T9SS type A sorting domain-containing protein [Flavobacteriaceae bacterium]